MLIASRSARHTAPARLHSADETRGKGGSLVRGMQSRGLREQYASGLRALRPSAPFRALLGAFVLQALATGTMLAGAQYVARWVLGDESAIEILFLALVGPALIATPGWTVIAKRTGKERAFLGASILFLLASASIIAAIWMPGAWLYAAVAVAGIASLMLAATGYVSSVAGAEVVQPDAAVVGIVLSFSVLPAALMALSILPLSRYRLRRTDIERAEVGPSAGAPA